MLSRSISRSTRHTTLLTPLNTCQVCTCNCGRAFASNEVNGPPRRPYASTRPPPPARPNPYKRAVEIKAKDEAIKETKKSPIRAKYWWMFERMRKLGLTKCEPETILEFLDGFVTLTRTRSVKTGFVVEPTALIQLLDTTVQEYMAAHFCARWLMLHHDLESVRLGKKLMYSMSHIGDGWSTLLIIENTLIEAKRQPKLLKNPDLIYARQHLTDMAMGRKRYPISEQHFVTQVCEGRVAYLLGDVQYAIDMWTAALDGAVAFAAGDQALDRSTDHPALRANLAPWIELTSVYYAQGDYENAKTAAEIGCTLDDPLSHYFAGLLERRTNDAGQHVPTTAWLHHTTKAAGAGHVRAAHSLGIFYATSEWKYVEDEPPDVVKPTPFDSYPPAESSAASVTSFAQRFGYVFGLQPPPLMEEKHSLFKTASFPSTPYDRWKMAIQWLETSMHLLYAPSFLVAAKLYLEKDLWPQAAAPKEALQLSDKRYDYASRADYDEGKRIEKPGLDDSAGVETIPNPGYNPEKAKELIREVFYAVQATAYRQFALRKMATFRSRGVSAAVQGLVDRDKILNEEFIGDQIPSSIRKWFRFPETMDMYVDEDRGILYDDSLKVDLEVEARQICDDQRWDIYDEDDGLVYKHGLSGKTMIPDFQELYK